MSQEAPSQDGHTEPAGTRRPAWIVPTAVGVGMVLVGGVVAAVLTQRDGGPATPQTPDVAVTTVVLPVPTPAVPPVAREATTAFASSLPDAVLQYALASSQADTEWQGAGAIEAWTDTLTDGSSGTVSVRAGQWETPEEAAAFAAQLAAALPAGAPSPGPTEGTEGEDARPALPQSGEVLVGGAPVGTFTIADVGGGTGIAVWTNATAVFQLTAPVEDVVDLYDAYPL